jgi:signal transduction histidine kinase
MKKMFINRLPSMEAVANTVGNLIMKRTDAANYVIKRKAFYILKAFLTFVYSPKFKAMSTYYSSGRREITFALMLWLYFMPIGITAQTPNLHHNFEKYLLKAQQDTLSPIMRERYLKIAYSAIRATRADSVKYSRISKLVEVAEHLPDTSYFIRIAAEGMQLAKDLENPAHLGDAHWNYASYYLRGKQFGKSYEHYNRAYKYFTAAKNDYYAGKMLYNMAYIASETHDLTGAEILLFRCIKIFEQAKKPRQQYRCYNVLGNNADDMEEFDKSLHYYKKAAQLIPSFKDSQYYKLENLNNKGVRLYKMGQFDKAESIFTNALTYVEELRRSPALHAMLLDNKAYCAVSLGALDQVDKDMRYAMRLRDSLGETAGSITSRLHFANYYGKTGDTLEAIAFAKEAYTMANGNSLTHHKLDALELLAALDRPNTIFYLRQHIQVDKSINARDRKLRNKFTAIQYETAKYIAENERLFRQRLWILIVGVSISAISILLYLNKRQRSKNRELLFEREQQQYDEDMYLMALTQKTNLEKGRTEERQRISKELHDHIVSRLFTLRFQWQTAPVGGEKEMLSLNRKNLNLLEQLEREIRNLSHKLRSIVYTEEERFLDTLKTLLAEKSEIGKLTALFECKNPADWQQLSYVSKINLQRIVEEVLQNVIKHARAHKISILMYRELDTLFLNITDDGKGFKYARIKRGLGMKNMEARSQKLNGTFSIQSTLGIGTTVMIRISFKLNIQ